MPLRPKAFDQGPSKRNNPAKKNLAGLFGVWLGQIAPNFLHQGLHQVLHHVFTPRRTLQVVYLERLMNRGDWI